MKFLQRIFSGVRPIYLIRSYLISLFFFGLMLSTVLNAETKTSTPIGTIVFSTSSAVLFPFAKLVWDELRDLAFGNNIIFMNAVFLLILKLFVNVLLWGARSSLRQLEFCTYGSVLASRKIPLNCSPFGY